MKLRFLVKNATTLCLRHQSSVNKEDVTTVEFSVRFILCPICIRFPHSNLFVFLCVNFRSDVSFKYFNIRFNSFQFSCDGRFIFCAKIETLTEISGRVFLKYLLKYRVRMFLVSLYSTIADHYSGSES